VEELRTSSNLLFTLTLFNVNGIGCWYDPGRVSGAAAGAMTHSEELQQYADEFRASGLLGKPGALSRLFDFLLAKSVAGEVPKELEIAVEVFGKKSGFDVSQDAVVRVYVHKLRKRLEEFGARDEPSRASRICIPKGEYRLVLEPSGFELPASAPGEEGTVESAPVIIPATRGHSPRHWPRLVLFGLSLIAALVAGALLATAALGERPWESYSVRHSAVWGPLLDDDLPITIVVGDYYLLGETDERSQIRRLVREFFINSHEDFLEHLELNPQLMQRYRNLDLTYLPAASAFALQDIVPVLRTGKPVRITLMSDLDPNTLKGSHIVYIGYISGLGLLGDPVFTASRLSPGGSFDELYDSRTQTTYVSTVMPSTGAGGFKDYGYFSTFDGPAGNRIVIISGTRDTGVRHVAETLSQRAGVRAVTVRAADFASFESLYEIDGMARAGLNAQLLFVSGLESGRIWTAR
jgi:hypothetical protein